VAAVIEHDGLNLIAKRPDEKRHGGKWEFPGGKIESGETVREAVARELREELGVEVIDVAASHFSVIDHGSGFTIEFADVTIEGAPTAIEHEALAWIALSELETFDLAPSDRSYV
jgi:mutator protein MutT